MPLKLPIFSLFQQLLFESFWILFFFFLKFSLKCEYLAAMIWYSTEVTAEPNAETHMFSLLFSSDLMRTNIPLTLQPICILSAYVHLIIHTFFIPAVFLGNLPYWHVALIFNPICMILHKRMESCIRYLCTGCLLHSEVTVSFWSTSCYVFAVKWYLWKLAALAFLCRWTHSLPKVVSGVENFTTAKIQVV